MAGMRMSNSVFYEKEFNTRSEAMSYLAGLNDMVRRGFSDAKITSEMVIMQGAIKLIIRLEK
jgi:uncharacterized protein YfcZ (UPF0381/DUF406 family)